MKKKVWLCHIKYGCEHETKEAAQSHQDELSQQVEENEIPLLDPPFYVMREKELQAKADGKEG